MSFTDLHRNYLITITKDLIDHFKHQENRSPYKTYYLKDFWGIMLRSDSMIEDLIGKTLQLHIGPNLRKTKDDTPFVAGWKMTLKEPEQADLKKIYLKFGMVGRTGMLNPSECALICYDSRQNAVGYILMLEEN